MEWLKKRYRLLQSIIHSNASMDREVIEEAVAVNMVRIFWTAIIIGAVHMLVALDFWLLEPPVMPTPTEITWRKWVLSANLSMAAMDFLFALGAWLIRKKGMGHKIQKMFQNTVIIYVLAMGLLISIIDQLVIPSISPLIISLVIVGTFYYVPPKQSFLIYTIFYLSFRFTFMSFTNTTDNILASNLINGFVACAMGLSLSVVNWWHFRRLKIQQKTIVQQKQQLEQMAYQDSLTGLPNRRWLDELMKSEVALVQRKKVESGLIIMDIDNFKSINDTYGHPVGDAMLRNFACLLRENIRSSNTLARIGGEEFVILVRSTMEGQCAVLAERLRVIVSEHVFRVDHHEIRITASFGVATLLGSEGVNDYYAKADQALYRAKKSRKNCVVVFDHLAAVDR